MNANDLKARINTNLREVMTKTVSRQKAADSICEAFKKFAKEREMPIDGVEKRVSEAIDDFLEDVNPRAPGQAIHDAMDHILYG